MSRAIILQGTVVLVFGALVFFIRARQARREMDESMAAENAARVVSSLNTAGELEAKVEAHDSIVMVGLEKVPDVKGILGQSVDTYGHDA